jgi:CRP/FNR family transcriptional regulator, cyclic AMP receptor protein
MVKVEDLKRINLLKHIPEHLLEIIAAEAQLSIFGTDTQLVAMNEPMRYFYMLMMGQVGIRRNITPDIDVIIEFIQSGNSFGASVLLGENKSFYTAVCQEPCEIITVSGERMRHLFEQNHELAYHVLKSVSKRYKRFMDKQARMVFETYHAQHADAQADIYEKWTDQIS